MSSNTCCWRIRRCESCDENSNSRVSVAAFMNVLCRLSETSNYQSTSYPRFTSIVPRCCHLHRRPSTLYPIVACGNIVRELYIFTLWILYCQFIPPLSFCSKLPTSKPSPEPRTTAYRSIATTLLFFFSSNSSLAYRSLHPGSPRRQEPVNIPSPNPRASRDSLQYAIPSLAFMDRVSA